MGINGQCIACDLSPKEIITVDNPASGAEDCISAVDGSNLHPCST